MKRLVFVLGTIAALLAAAALFSPPTYAAADARCASDPSSGAIGSVFHITCGGYTPNSYVYAYLVEPSGVAVPLFDESGALQVDKGGMVHYAQPSRFQDVALATGTWHFVAEELGLAKSVLHRGETSFRVTGGTEGVSGASLSATPPVIHKPEVAYGGMNDQSLHLSFLNFSAPVTLSGSGFAPGEMVSFWFEPPGGGCPTFTSHVGANLSTVIVGVGGIFETVWQNSPVYDGYSAQSFVTVKADRSGSVVGDIEFSSLACEGAWHMVARGNTSHRGGDTVIKVLGNAITTNAALTASPHSASAMFGRVQFDASGFGPNEILSCWLTSPRGQALGYPDNLPIEGDLGGVTVKSIRFTTDAAGRASFELVTGSNYVNLSETIVVQGNGQHYQVEFLEPVASEGALGVYAMTCRGNSSGKTGIARFTLTGGVVDP